jgi:hypothetical protein
MGIEIKPETVKEIAEMLDAGMVCFYHKTNHELEYYPYEFRNPGFDQEMWAEVIDKVEENYGDYIRFEGMDSSEAFRVMESFINDIDHIPTHNKLIGAISRKKPFAHFNDLLFDYPKLRQQWFAYKLEIYIAFVKEQVECE